MRALLITLIMLPLSAAHASPIYYEAVFDVLNVYGAAPPAEWGNVAAGSSALVHFGWDPDSVTNPSSSVMEGGPLFTYSMTVGDATIFSGSMDSFRSAGSTSIFVEDIFPHVCTPPDPCASGAGDWFVDEVFFNFGCSSWAGAPSLLPNLDCASPLTGSLNFELFGPIYHEQSFGIQASLVGLKAVPEPGGFTLIAVGLAGIWIARRRTLRLKAHIGR
jgi:hypothetical protein